MLPTVIDPERRSTSDLRFEQIARDIAEIKAVQKEQLSGDRTFRENYIAQLTKGQEISTTMRAELTRNNEALYGHDGHVGVVEVVNRIVWVGGGILLLYGTLLAPLIVGVGVWVLIQVLGKFAGP